MKLSNWNIAEFSGKSFEMTKKQAAIHEDLDGEKFDYGRDTFARNGLS